MGKKKRWILLFCILLCFMAAACKDIKPDPAVPLQEAWKEPETELNVLAYTLDEEGNLYTLEVDTNAGENTNLFTEDGQLLVTLEEYLMLSQNVPDRFFLRKYNPEGKQEFSKALDDNWSNYVRSMAIRDGVVYFVPYTYVDNEECAVLCSFCPETDEFTVMKKLPYFKIVNRIIAMEDCFYVFGSNMINNNGRNSLKYDYNGEKIVCYTVSSDRFEELGIEEPMDIGMAEKGQLFVYAHKGDEFYLLLYDISQDTMKVIAKLEDYKIANVAYCREQQEIIYWTGNNGLVISAISNPEVESELYPEGCLWDNGLSYINGYVAFRTLDNTVRWFSLKDVKTENKFLRCIISEGTEYEKPFGCGYEIKQTVLDADKCALKIMALDKDFDVCLVDSSDSFGYNLKENGVFYPLNEIEGIHEYMNSCFPYVKEVATDRDGNIWMLPVSVNIPSILMSKEESEKAVLENSMTFEEYCLAYEALSEDEKKETERPDFYASKFVVQYILDRGTVDTAEFRQVMQRMMNSWSVQTDNKYREMNTESDYRAFFVQKYGPEATVHAEPKLKAGDTNVGSCVFLAVNPYSDNLEETLQYISSLIAYMMKMEKTPLFFESRQVADTPYDRSVDEIYRNGDIAFYVDQDVYADYKDVLNGTLSLENYVMETEKKIKIFFNE